MNYLRVEDYPEAYANAADIFRVAATDQILPAEQLTVSQCAEKYLTIKGAPVNYDEAPHLRAIADSLGDDNYRLTVTQGPAQSWKSTVYDHWLAWTALVSPANVLWLQQDRATVADYVGEHINPMIAGSKALKDRQLTDPGSDNIHKKQFRGCTFWFSWPVGATFRMRTAARYVGDDWDGIPQKIKGEGSTKRLLEGRQAAVELQAKGGLVSSPALGPKKGIEYERRQGTDKRRHVPCPHCGAPFELCFAEQASFEKNGSPEEAKLSVSLTCPTNGCVIEPSRKGWMNARGAWIGRGQRAETVEREDGTPQVVAVGDLIATDVDSYLIDGALSHRSWGELARIGREAEIKFELVQDEEDLRSFYNTALGLNYRSRLIDKQPLEDGELDAHKRDYRLGQVPHWVRLLTAAVDIQSNRFEIMVVGWGDELRSCVVDRFAISHLDDGRTQIQPAERPEHWRVLLPWVFDRRYPVLDADGQPAGEDLPIWRVAYDTGGEDQVDENAKKFWHAARGFGVLSDRLCPVKGDAGRKRPMVPPPTFLERTAGDKPKKHGAKVWVINVHRIKGVLDARLRREEDGPGYISLPSDFSKIHAEELLSEERDEDGEWIKRDGRPRNETWDLYVYNTFALIRKVGERSEIGDVPSWARPKKLDPQAATEAGANGVRGLPARSRPEDRSAQLANLISGGSVAGTVEE